MTVIRLNFTGPGEIFQLKVCPFGTASRDTVMKTENTHIAAPSVGQVNGNPESHGPSVYRWRRALILGLNLATIAGLAATLAYILSSGGWTILDTVMIIAFVSTLPWVSLGFWNSILGFIILRAVKDPVGFVTPGIRKIRGDEDIAGRVAIAMTIRNESTREALARIKVLKTELDQTDQHARFDYHVLSDTSEPEIAAEEEAAIAAWRAMSDAPDRIHYRRRTDNAGFKAGNVWEFVSRCVEDYDYFIPLDADSLMSGGAVLRLTRIMEANPNYGILQGLVVGRPAESFFARVFQFGMRHGMRSYTTGSAWWHGDCGPFWGHNAILRMRPFRDHCALPTIPGRHTLSGYILSHDQVEAVLMRRAGYEVRVLAEEDESWEDNPPTLPDFIKRDLRWCQGNMQYFWLLGMPGLPLMSRIQLLLAILMYVGAPGWMLFIALGVVHGVIYPDVTFPAEVGWGLLATVISMSFMPKLMGILDIMARAGSRRRYGGAFRILMGTVVEFVVSALIAPVVSFAQARFMTGLLFGKTMGWGTQRRESVNLGFWEACRGLWLQTAYGLLLLGALAVFIPGVIPWAAPILISFLGAVPIAVGTASAALGRWSARRGLCDIPEDRTEAPTLKMFPQTI